MYKSAPLLPFTCALELEHLATVASRNCCALEHLVTVAANKPKHLAMVPNRTHSLLPHAQCSTMCTALDVECIFMHECATCYLAQAGAYRHCQCPGAKTCK
jgi:hypothetical protein